MNKYAQEVINRSNPKILSLMAKDFPKGFFIVASDTDQFVIGDGTKNISYSRTTGKILGTCIFSAKTKLSRKGF